MSGAQRGSVGGEQLLPLWTWLLEGYVPVAHIVADLDEVEALEPNEPAAERDGASYGRPRLVRAAAA
jgi:hypothetical protein